MPRICTQVLSFKEAAFQLGLARRIRLEGGMSPGRPEVPALLLVGLHGKDHEGRDSEEDRLAFGEPKRSGPKV